jgi:putative nucleotidyltransferase with HDIG domain
MTAGISMAAWFSRAFPQPSGQSQLGWWALLFASSGVTVGAVDRLARRLLPLAILLRLTLLFPDRAPSRFAVARRVMSPRKLEEQVRLARQAGIHDDPTHAAEMVLALVAALSAHDRKTRGHSERVRVLTDLLAEEMHIPEPKRDRLRWAALLHDIGKLEVSARILNKPAEPNRREWKTLKHHPEAGARLTGPLLAWLGEWGPAIEQHHEQFDGTGYPDGLAGKEICRGARILAVTDSFETMTAPRSYKKPLSVARAREDLIRCAGSQFDPRVVRSFLNVSLGKLWWQVGPLAWLVQLPFLSLRTTGSTVAGAARTGVSAVAQATVGLVALGSTGFASAPALGEQRVPSASTLAATEADREEKTGGQGSGGEGGQEAETGSGQDAGDPADTGDDTTAGAAGQGSGSTDTGGEDTGGKPGRKGNDGAGEPPENGEGAGPDGGSPSEGGRSGDGISVGTDTVTDVVEDAAGAVGDLGDTAGDLTGEIPEVKGKVDELTEGTGQVVNDLLS